MTKVWMGLSLLISAALYIAFAYSARCKTNDVEDYFISKRNLSLSWSFSSFYASGLSLATVFIALIELTPKMGVQIFWAPLTYVIGFFLLGWLSPIIVRNTKGKSTLHGFLGERYQSPALQRIASIVSVIAFGGRFATEIVVGSLILNILSPGQGDLVLFMGIIFGIVILCTVVGGFRSVVSTDRLQSIFVFICCFTLFYMAWVLTGGDKSNNLVTLVGGSFSKALSEGSIFPWMVVLNFILINIPTMVVDMSIWQRINAARTDRVASRAVRLSSFLFLISWTLVIFSAFGFSIYHSGAGADVLVRALNEFSAIDDVKMVVAAITFCGLVAAMMSTADTFLIAAGQTCVVDLFGGANKYAGDRIIWYSKLTMLIGSVLFGIIVYYFNSIGVDVVSIVFIIYGSLLALFPATVYGLLRPPKDNGRKYKKAAIASVIMGFAGAWVFGIYTGASGMQQQGGVLQIIISLLPIDAVSTNTPIVALLISASVFVVVIVFQGMTRKNISDGARL